MVLVDTKDVTDAGTRERLTTTSSLCSSVFILPKVGNSGTDMYVVDESDDTKKFPIPSTGITLPINDPSLIWLDTDTGGDGVDWVAV